MLQIHKQAYHILFIFSPHSSLITRWILLFSLPKMQSPYKDFFFRKHCLPRQNYFIIFVTVALQGSIPITLLLSAPCRLRVASQKKFHFLKVHYLCILFQIHFVKISLSQRLQPCCIDVINLFLRSNSHVLIVLGRVGS